MSRRKKIVIIVTGIVTLLILASTGYFIFTVLQGSKSITTDDQVRQAAGIPTSTQLTARETLDKQAEIAAKTKDAAAGQAVYDAQLKTTSNAKDQAAIYSQKAAFATTTEGGNDLTTALDYAYKAEALSPDYGTAITIAQLEEATKDIPNAVKYYKLYLDRLTPDAIALNPGDKEAIEAKVTELEKQP